MIKKNKIALSSWIYAAVYLLWGILLYTVVPQFTGLLKEMKVTLPPPRSLILSTPSIAWLLIYCVIAALVLLRDISGKRSLFPNWAALTILIISAVYFIYALFAPVIGFVDVQTSNISLQRTALASCFNVAAAEFKR